MRLRNRLTGEVTGWCDALVEHGRNRCETDTCTLPLYPKCRRSYEGMVSIISRYYAAHDRNRNDPMPMESGNLEPFMEFHETLLLMYEWFMETSKQANRPRILKMAIGRLIMNPLLLNSIKL